MKRNFARVLAFLIGALALAATVSAVTTEVKIMAGDGAASDYFGGNYGTGVSISGDFAIVGAAGVDDPNSTNPDLANDPSVNFFGAAYVFNYDGSNWLEKQKLTASDGAASDNFGTSVSISGNNAIVGAYYGDGNVADSGAAYIYHYDGTNWVEQQKLIASDGDAYDHFGEFVSISGNYAIVGAYAAGLYPDNSGQAYIYHYDGTNWVEQQKLTPSDGTSGDWFGHAVSISVDYAIVGAMLNDDYGTASGAAYVFHYDGTRWVEQQKILASDGVDNDRFGSAVSVSDSDAIIGASHGDGVAADSGAAYVYQFDGTSWVEQQKLTALDGSLNDRFGNSVSIAADNIIVGGTGGNSESAYLYKYDGTEWISTEIIVASDAASADRFGWAVSISATNAIVGASFDDDSAVNSGSAYIYTGFPADPVLIDNDNDGFALPDDCNDNDPSFNPGAVEVCGDGLDNDCDGVQDSSDPDCPFNIDADNDGYILPDDCDDNDASINPGILEGTTVLCSDGKDNDCNGSADLADPTCSIDADIDGYPVSEDCDDNHPFVNPGELEECMDGLDNNCDGLTDLFDPLCNVDNDGDGHIIAFDCNDNDPLINPSASEICNDGQDNDCDYKIDSLDPDCPADVDGDGYDVMVDCNDNVAAINPGAEEVCADEVDNNCDGLTDDEDPVCAPVCVPTDSREKGKTCKDGVDNDCDGLIDSVDPDCGGTVDPEPTPDAGGNEGKGKSCSDGIDNDADGLVDCDDPGCSASRICK